MQGAANPARGLGNCPTLGLEAQQGKEASMVKVNAPKLNNIGTIRHGTLTVKVKVLDIKLIYGRTRYQVTPVAGSGEDWIENVTMDEPKA